MSRPGKLEKFQQMATMPNVLQYPFAVLRNAGFPLRGKWNANHFAKDAPIVLELGCGKGEYTTGLASRYPDKNFIGVDIKGARMWTGANEALRQGVANAAFLRTNIELIEHFFAPGEVSEIWITFPDPQMKKSRHRLTSTRFVEMYRRILAPGGTIHLKTDSPFLHAYTTLVAKTNPDALRVEFDTDDLYAHVSELPDPALADIKTHYERQWLERGLTIKYISMTVGRDIPLEEPDDSLIPRDTYRSYGRGVTPAEAASK